FGQRAALEVTAIATLSGGGAVGVLLGGFVKSRSLTNLGEQFIRLGLRRGDLLGFSRSRILLLCRNQKFTQPDLFGLLHLALVSIVEFLQFLLADGHPGADFLGDNLLGDDLVLQVLL